ncbi:MAG TPA: hypothetical protein VL418_16655 [Devosiaceae bacterium]|jgi:hypothetical protein|nr:hypothetical protein [Devosiaceae bacterium]
MFRSILPAFLAMMTTASLIWPAVAARYPVQGDVWKIQLGQPTTAIPEGFADFACGTNGGPPSQPLSGWSDFMTCTPEANGWREVYFRYDDELEYWAKANNYDEIIAGAGTKVYGIPAVMSVLIDNKGIIKGLRLVNDPRDDSVRLEDQEALYSFLRNRFMSTGGKWNCTSQPLANGESPVNGTFVKDDCSMSVNGTQYSLSARYLRRAGERQIDPHTGQFTQNQFESNVRFEMHVD